ncbi:flavin reductase family protein [Radiobacillus sp. PE A8.2]|uniref:flavin reductase family protein n=1 Tax=Radiobacillus sp. PE A8.2 TaxID=3380349 RepID=UPI003890DDAA
MIIDHTQFSERQMDKLIKGAVVPRPIAWVSTVNKAGETNLAPYSFFTVASLDPITLCISIAAKEEGNGAKDTLNNIREIGDFVINIVNAPLANAMYESSLNVPPHESEFELAGLTTAKSKHVTSPRVAESPISMECQLDQLIPVGNSTLVLGTLVCYHIDEEILADNDKVDPHNLEVIGRMAGDYTYSNNFFSLPIKKFPSRK